MLWHLYITHSISKTRYHLKLKACDVQKNYCFRVDLVESVHKASFVAMVIYFPVVCIAQVIGGHNIFYSNEKIL